MSIIEYIYLRESRQKRAGFVPTAENVWWERDLYVLGQLWRRGEDKFPFKPVIWPDFLSHGLGQLYSEDIVMALIGGRLAALILKRYDWHDLEARPGYSGRGKLNSLFGPEFWTQIRGKTVIDFGCGHGAEAIEMARCSAARVIGVEALERYVSIARENLALSGVKNCEFVGRTDELADVILSLDSFEHFDHPDRILKEMARLLKPDGRVIASFGWPWYHPLGGHMPLFPWAHLIISERALMTWRSKYKTDGATRFEEVDGGLNQMSIGKFERIISESPLRIEAMKTIPIRSVRRLHCRLTREFFTSVIQAVLVHRSICGSTRGCDG